jgi:hypothetical protein
VTKSHTIGQIGLMERENAAILNETLKVDRRVLLMYPVRAQWEAIFIDMNTCVLHIIIIESAGVMTDSTTRRT